MDASLSKSENFLYALPRFALVGKDAYQPGLERMQAILEHLGHPETSFRSIHVAGTNGKGSTSSFIAAIATVSGRTTGLHTSPHLLHVGERMRVNGIPAGSDWLDHHVEQFEDLFRETGASFFEVTTALSFLYFAQNGVDLAVVEVGLGGRFDATNVLQPELSIITGVGLDHQDILGESLEQIAREKAGIFKPGVPAITGAVQHRVLNVLEDAAERAGTVLHVLDREVSFREEPSGLTGAISMTTPMGTYRDLQPDLPGIHQLRNAALAVRAVELCPQLIASDAAGIKQGLRRVRQIAGIRARGEVILQRPRVVVDVAHNAEGMIAAIDAVLTERTFVDRVFLGFMRDKHLEPFDEWLAEHGLTVTTLKLDSDRAMKADELAERLRSAHVDVVQTGLTVSDALDQFCDSANSSGVGIFLGSHLVAAEALKWLAAR